MQSVCPSVCLSHPSIVCKRLYVWRWNSFEFRIAETLFRRDHSDFALSNVFDTPPFTVSLSCLDASLSLLYRLPVLGVGSERVIVWSSSCVIVCGFPVRVLFWSGLTSIGDRRRLWCCAPLLFAAVYRVFCTASVDCLTSSSSQLRSQHIHDIFVAWACDTFCFFDAL